MRQDKFLVLPPYFYEPLIKHYPECKYNKNILKSGYVGNYKIIKERLK